MMNIVLLSPHFPPNYYNFAVALQQLGVNVLGIGDQPYPALRDELRASLTEYYWVNDLHNYDELLRACAYFTFHYGKLDRLESHNEHWLETDARLRTDFNIPGLKLHNMTYIKRKSQMKQKFVDAGLNVPHGTMVSTLESAQRFIAEVGYPVVAKPDIGVGAAGTYKIHGELELEHFFNTKPPEDYFMEEFIEGTIGSFDGLTDQNGRIVFCTAHRYAHGVMEIVNEGLNLIYYSLREIPEGLRDAGFKAVKAFQIRERFFHLEFFRQDDEWIALEINARPPGGLTMDMFNYANNIDLYQEWANIVVHNQFLSDYDRPYHCAHVSRRKIYRYQHSHKDILAAYGHLIVYHGPLDPVLAQAMGDYVYLIRSSDLEEVLEMGEFVHARENIHI